MNHNTRSKTRRKFNNRHDPEQRSNSEVKRSSNRNPANDIRISTLIDLSQNDEDSDSSLFFADEISEASCSRKDHPETLKKEVLVKKPRSQKNVSKKPVKRKELSATRKAAKRRKLDDTDDVEILESTEPSVISLDSDIDSDFLSQDELPTKYNTVVKKEKSFDRDANEDKKLQRTTTRLNNVNSTNTGKRIRPKLTPVKSKRIRVESEPVPVKSESVPVRSEPVPVKSEPVPVKSEPVPVKSEPVPVKSEPVQVKSEPILCNVKQEKSNENKISAEKSQKPSKHTKNAPNIPIKTENIKTELKKGDKQQIFRTVNKKTKPNSLEYEAELLAEFMNIDFYLAKNIITLFNDDCTIPFIARYRRENTQNMDADQLRQIKVAYDYIKTLEKKVDKTIAKLSTAGKLTEDLENLIRKAHSLDEIDFLYAPYKRNTISRAEKSRKLGLEGAAMMILEGSAELDLKTLVKPKIEGLKTIDEVYKSLQNIIADVIAKDSEVLRYIRKIEQKVIITLQSTRKTRNAVEDTEKKFENYYHFEKSIQQILPHQVLAINRGENQNILSANVQISESFFSKLKEFCRNKWLNKGKQYISRQNLFEESVTDSYKRLIHPSLTRRIRANLTRTATDQAVENFALNLKSLLQTQPVKGCSIMGIDPGLRHGAKFALISPHGDVLWTSVLHFDFRDFNAYINEQNMATIKKVMVQHNCELIAIGNGKGSKEIEILIDKFLKKGFFAPKMNISYTFVNERGASIYSVSSIAKEEFPHLDPNLISAVFIARTLQDPLSEYVKVEPKHLGVGMYQHDIPEPKLNQSLEEVVIECVSFTGADLNTASIHLLKRVAGLGPTRAANIIQWRKENGAFINRQQLLEVKNIGPKTFEQCSGFLRIHPDSCNNKIENIKDKIPSNNQYNPLDQTWIHPESYNVAYSILGLCESNLYDLGSQKFIENVNRTLNTKDLNTIASNLGHTPQTVQLVFEALLQPKNYDCRAEFNKPTLRKGLLDSTNIKPGDILRGTVSNVTGFGAFVDIGVERDALIFTNNMKRINVKVGDFVEVSVISVERERKRINLCFKRKL